MVYSLRRIQQNLHWLTDYVHERAVNCGLVKTDNMKQAILLLSFGTPRQPSDYYPI